MSSKKPTLIMYRILLLAAICGVSVFVQAKILDNILTDGNDIIPDTAETKDDKNVEKVKAKATGDEISYTDMEEEHKEEPDEDQDQKMSHEPKRSFIKREAGIDYKYTQLHSSGFGLNIFLVENVHGNRRKRALNKNAPMWAPPYKIPIDFDVSYGDPALRNLVMRVLRYVSSRLCFTFVDVTSTINTTNPNWCTQNGFPLNTFIKVISGSGCSTAGGGPQSGNTPLITAPCNDWKIILHEFMHSFNGAHGQENYVARKYTSILADNIQPTLLFTYNSNNPAITGVAFDCASTMMYWNDTWTQNGDNTMVSMVEDLCNSDEAMSSENCIFYELNDRYKCNEVACNNANIDCCPGYFARVNNVCRCVCPSELDSTTNCKTLIDKANSKLEWPTLVTIMSGAPDHSCPAGFNPTAWLSFCGIWDILQQPSPVDMPRGSKTVYIPICSKTTPTDNVDWEKMPFGGGYCVIKPKSVNCGGVFIEYTIQYESLCPVQYNGTLGDITVNGNSTTIKFCCRPSDVNSFSMDLPNDKAFRLISSGYCPKIRGMRFYKYMIDLYTKTKTLYGGSAKPDIYTYSNEIQIYLCFYQPPVYGCNVNVSFNFTQKSVTITTPGYPQGRTPDKRCFYSFSAPEGAKIKITFNKIDLALDDKLLYKRDSMWTDPTSVDLTSPEYQLISEGNYLCLEYWASYRTVNNSGVNLTAEVILPEDQCYNSATGEDYLGDQSISETYELCLSWKQTINSSDSPYNGVEAILTYLEDNKCRNPGGNLLRPWCFVYQNGSVTIKRYCDPCNSKAVVDQLNTTRCAAAISEDPLLCSSIQKYSCFKSCNLTRPPSPASACPANCVNYKGRCLYISTTLATRAQAKAYCESLGPSGALFRIQTEEDQKFVRAQKVAKNVTDLAHTWVDCGELKQNNGDWKYTDTNITLCYYNWTTGAATNNANYNCCYLYKEASSVGYNGGWSTAECENTANSFTYACQINRISTCGPPSIPDDGALVGCLKPSYTVGERVAIQCKYSNYSNDAKGYMLCKKEGWTTLKSACSECPKSWTVDGNRCLFFNISQFTMAEAEAYCKAQGRNGALMRIMNVTDQTNAKNLRMAYGASVNDHACIGGKFVSGVGWMFPEINVSMIYYNFLGATPTNPKYDCIYLYRLYSSSNRSGSWVAISCNDNVTKCIAACQMDKLVLSTMDDTVTTCQAALDHNPKFCTDSRSSEAMTTCKKSCGLTPGGTSCTAPTSSTYTRTSSSATIKSGDYFTFACNQGYYFLGGDLIRACGVNGILRGSEPVCNNNPSALNVLLHLVRNRNNALAGNLAILLDYDGYRVPFKGKITTWYAFCKNRVDIHFLVFRKNESNYVYVGHNKFICQPWRAWGYNVVPNNQILVSKDDVVGVYSNSPTLAYSDGTNAPVKLMSVNTAPGSSISEIQNVTVATGIKYFIPALGFRVDLR